MDMANTSVLLMEYGSEMILQRLQFVKVGQNCACNDLNCNTSYPKLSLQDP